MNLTKKELEILLHLLERRLAAGHDPDVWDLSAKIRAELVGYKSKEAV